MSSRPLPVAPGDVVARKFQVESILGAGGVGMVVAARHLQLGETVALKFLLPDAICNETDVARFLLEARSAARLKDEHVARVSDVGTLDDGVPYIVMEYLKGVDLSQLVEREGALEPDVAVDYVLQACEAVAEAHSLGIVHRDLKPANLFVTQRSDGTPLIKVLDFGIAKSQIELELGDANLTRTHTLLGSPVYMSPEQLRNARSVDARTDVWSLGVCLYELLTGTVPFHGDSVTGIAAAVASDPLPPVRERRPGLDSGLATVVERCLEKPLDKRYQSVAELAQALRPFAAGRSLLSIARILGILGVQPRPGAPGASERSASDADRLATSTTLREPVPEPNEALSRGRRWAAFGIAAGLALLAAFAVPWLVGLRRPAPPSPVQAQQSAAEEVLPLAAPRGPIVSPTPSSAARVAPTTVGDPEPSRVQDAGTSRIGRPLAQAGSTPSSLPASPTLRTSVPIAPVARAPITRPRVQGAVPVPPAPKSAASSENAASERRTAPSGTATKALGGGIIDKTVDTRR